MSNPALNLTFLATVIACCECGINFAVNDTVYTQWRQDSNKWFYCPNGHRQHYSEGEVQRLRKQLAQAEHDRDWHKTNAANEREAREKTARSLRAVKAAKSRIVNRVKNGVCPCCHRSFENLRRHMETKHKGMKL